MAVTAITYRRVMGRWEPDARGRLARAALTLYAEQGFDQTTAAQIAEHAGLSERTFFRHFTDKREVLFYGTEMARDLLTRTITNPASPATPMEARDAVDAVSAALQALCATFQEDPKRVRQRNAVIAANPELRERDLTKHAELAAAMADALRGRGIPDPAASLAAETGLAVFKVAFASWISEADQLDLPETFRAAMSELRHTLAGLAST